MEEYPKKFDCTHIDLRCENITKQELLDYIKERLDKLTDRDMLSDVSGYAVVSVELKTHLAADESNQTSPCSHKYAPHSEHLV